MGSNTETIVTKVPKCDFCEEPAEYNARTRFGPWAYLCEKHFKMYGVGLGLGRGQTLIEREKEEAEVRITA